MNRHPPPGYGDGNMNIPYGGGGSGQRMRGNMAAMNDNYGGGRQDGYSNVEAEQHPGYNKSSKAEGSWQWDREPQNVHSQLPPHGFSEGQGGNGTRPYYHAQQHDPKLGLESQANKEANRSQNLEQDMELGYEDNALPITFEGLQRKFYDEATTLAKEQIDAEDAENARHREKIMEINTRYQEKLSALRAQQANRREEFLRMESQARLSQYQQQASMSHYPNTSLQDAHGYGSATAYASNQFESPYRERPQYGGGGGRAQVSEGRVPYPEGRVYNNAGARYY